MPTATVTYTFTNVTDIVDAVKFNQNFTDLVTLLNGQLDATNLATGAVTAAKLATDAVTTAKILDLNVTNAKLAGSITLAKLLAAPTSVGRTVWLTGADVVPVSLSQSGNQAWTAVDLTASTSAKAIQAKLMAKVTFSNLGTSGQAFTIGVRRNGDTVGAHARDYIYKALAGQLLTGADYRIHFDIGLDSGQIFEYDVEVGTGTWTYTLDFYLRGYTEDWTE